MVEHGRVELLSHPLCLAYINMKWLPIIITTIIPIIITITITKCRKAYGCTFFVFTIALYLSFLALLTYSVLTRPLTLAGTNITVLLLTISSPSPPFPIWSWRHPGR